MNRFLLHGHWSNVCRISTLGVNKCQSQAQISFRVAPLMATLATLFCRPLWYLTPFGASSFDIRVDVLSMFEYTEEPSLSPFLCWTAGFHSQHKLHINIEPIAPMKWNSINFPTSNSKPSTFWPQIFGRCQAAFLADTFGHGQLDVLGWSRGTSVWRTLGTSQKAVWSQKNIMNKKSIELGI